MVVLFSKFLAVSNELVYFRRGTLPLGHGDVSEPYARGRRADRGAYDDRAWMLQRNAERRGIDVGGPRTAQVEVMAPMKLEEKT